MEYYVLKLPKKFEISIMLCFVYNSKKNIRLYKHLSYASFFNYFVPSF